MLGACKSHVFRSVSSLCLVHGTWGTIICAPVWGPHLHGRCLVVCRSTHQIHVERIKQQETATPGETVVGLQVELQAQAKCLWLQNPMSGLTEVDSLVHSIAPGVGLSVGAWVQTTSTQAAYQTLGCLHVQFKETCFQGDMMARLRQQLQRKELKRSNTGTGGEARATTYLG